MNLFLIEDIENNGGLVYTVGFDDSRAALRYIQRFGRPGWRVLPINWLSREDVEALPSRTVPNPNEIQWPEFKPERRSA